MTTFLHSLSQGLSAQGLSEADSPQPKDAPGQAGVGISIWREKHLRAATRAAGVALWSWNVDTDAIAMDELAYDLWDVPKDAENLSFEILSQNIHPADLERVSSAFSATRAVLGCYEIDFRILAGSDIRWISARGQGADAEIADRVMFGIFLDVTQRKQAQESSDLLAGEMSHRVKNLLQLASSLTEMTSRSTATKEEMVRDLTHRLAALCTKDVCGRNVEHVARPCHP
jgi:hypothetical protein